MLGADDADFGLGLEELYKALLQRQLQLPHGLESVDDRLPVDLSAFGPAGHDVQIAGKGVEAGAALVHDPPELVLVGNAVGNKEMIRPLDLRERLGGSEE